jgi:hypothetical protein
MKFNEFIDIELIHKIDEKGSAKKGLATMNFLRG